MVEDYRALLDVVENYQVLRIKRIEMLLLIAYL